jgi:hypothetical protein
MVLVEDWRRVVLALYIIHGETPSCPLVVGFLGNVFVPKVKVRRERRVGKRYCRKLCRCRISLELVRLIGWPVKVAVCRMVSMRFALPRLVSMHGGKLFLVVLRRLWFAPVGVV